MEELARAGTCALLQVELDRKPGEDTPRVTVRSAQPFDRLSKRTRLQLEVAAEDETAIRSLATMLAGEHGGSGQIHLRVPTRNGHADIVLGRDFNLDAETAARIERLDGIPSVRLAAAEPPRLALVS